MPRIDTLVPWPEPTAEALAHSDRLVGHIRERIEAAGGVIGFDTYMDLALYAPGLGYYSAGAAKFGAAGDFITAPEMTGLFGLTLARVLAPVVADCDGVVLELGAGSGHLAVDLFTGLLAADAPPSAYCILEPSADLRARQQARVAEALPVWRDRFHWLDRLPAEPLTGAIVANEVLDALPAARFRIRPDGGAEGLGVGWSGDRFIEQPCAPPAALVGLLASLRDDYGIELPPGYVSELVPALPAWVRGLADTLRRGMVLLIDYGYPRREYYLPQRDRGTLICHYRHRAHDDLFRLPGLQDITASVDFTAVAEAALAAGLEVLGYGPQGPFLMAAGLDAVLAARAADDGQADLRAVQQAKQLILPGEMGERFGVMALGRGVDGPLPAFSLADHRHRL